MGAATIYNSVRCDGVVTIIQSGLQIGLGTDS